MKRIAVILATTLALTGCPQRTTVPYKDVQDLDVYIDDAHGVICYRTVMDGSYGKSVALSCVNVSVPR